jgi:hypothetical protein
MQAEVRTVNGLQPWSPISPICRRADRAVIQCELDERPDPPDLQRVRSPAVGRAERGAPARARPPVLDGPGPGAARHQHSTGALSAGWSPAEILHGPPVDEHRVRESAAVDSASSPPRARRLASGGSVRLGDAGRILRVVGSSSMAVSRASAHRTLGGGRAGPPRGGDAVPSARAGLWHGPGRHGHPSHVRTGNARRRSSWPSIPVASWSSSSRTAIGRGGGWAAGPPTWPGSSSPPTWEVRPGLTGHHGTGAPPCHSPSGSATGNERPPLSRASPGPAALAHDSSP